MSSRIHENSDDAQHLLAESSHPNPIITTNNSGGGRGDDNTQATWFGSDAMPNFIAGSPEALREGTLGTSLSATASVFAGETSALAAQGLETSSLDNITAEPHSERSRPRLGRRNVSSPLVAAFRRRGQSASARMSGGLKNPTPTQSSHRQAPTPHHEWSLFGQMMENEGQLPASPSAASYISSMSANSYTRNWTMRDSASNTRAEAVQSPLAGEHPEDMFSQEAQGGASSANTQSPEELGLHDYDSEYDSDTSESSQRTIGPSSAGASTTAEGSGASRRKWFSRENLPTLTPLHKNVLKCAIAYFVSSLFTFSPTLSNFIGDIASYGPGASAPSNSAHMVATIAVYFNPAKTAGAMVEADIFFLLGLVYSFFVCGVFTSAFWWFEVRPGYEWVGDVLAIIWIGLSMSLVAWMKVWMANPSFNTACSMTTILIFVVVVKEGGVQTLMGVSTIVICGSLVSNLVCYLIWPQTATDNLQKNMTKTLASFSTLLSMLTNGFLLENENFIKKTGIEKVQKAVEDHQSSFTSLKKNLAEAKKEWLDSGERTATSVLGMVPSSRNKRKRAYEDAVDSLNRLAQHLNGLRSSARLQYELTKSGVHKRSKGKGVKIPDQGMTLDEGMLLKAAAEMFGALVDEVGPPLKALTKACTTTLGQLKEAFLKARINKLPDRDSATGPPEFMDLVDDIEKALVRFESTSNHALLRLYKRVDISDISRSSIASFDQRSSRTSEGLDDSKNTLLTSHENEHVFLVYFFIFTLQEFSRELVALVDAMERIYECEQLRLHRRSWMIQAIGSLAKAPYTLFSKWRSNKREKIPRRQSNLRRRISAYLVPEHRVAHPGFPKIKPHAPNTIQTPSRKNLPFIGRVKQTLWAIGDRMKERDIKFALKAGMATAILATPAFFDVTRPFFVQNWGDWALISFFVVISPTIGATNYLSLHRILGTLFGAAVAAGIYTAFPHNAYVLSIFGFLFSLPCFYVAISRPQYISASRFLLLTYNLTCLYSYNIRKRDVSVSSIAVQRALAVTAGVVWAALVSRFWWPSEARRELSRALGEFCLNMGWLYTRLVASNSYSPEPTTRQEPGEEAALLVGHDEDIKMKDSIHEFMAMELHLQIKLIELQGLLAQTQHEPRLKGPFPIQLYRRVLTSLQTILDRLHSMRCVTTKEEWHKSVRRDFIIPVNKERREMVGNIILSFTLLASAFRLKEPLPPYLPPAERARQRLVEAIRNLDVVKNREVKVSRQLLFFAYAMTMQGVTQELETLGKMCQDAFGVIGQTPEEFEALFITSDQIQSRISGVA
ncbi:hypothetical protein NP233_g9021 [Leucocoprinus birnbaumii]|uniref:DUF2421 domain-containing protein n=1 Tax=Leucocoprinus birnbaumii TaxID=56174 RepID=A0AAD5VMY5_9AGAR|nr:hypothetical protein NP233_g9021 [Leucocoprinus birnbaumii]